PNPQHPKNIRSRRLTVIEESPRKAVIHQAGAKNSRVGGQALFSMACISARSSMTTRTPRRVQRVWDWLTGTRAQRSTYWLILGPTIGLTCIGVVMVVSASSVEAIGGAGSFASLTSQGLYAAL